MTEITKTKETKGWTEERRRAQAERIRRVKPWTKSTGPTSAEGKARSSQNGLTHGRTSKNGKRVRKALHEHRQIIVLLEMIGKSLSSPFNQ